MSQKHTKKPHLKSPLWEDPFDCDYYAAKGPDILRIDNLEYARKCVLACAGLNPEAIQGMVDILENIASVQSKHNDPRFYELNDGLEGVIEMIVKYAAAALAEAKKVEEE